MRSDSDTHAAYLAADALTTPSLARVPVEEGRAAVERLFHERARHVAPFAVAAGGPYSALPSGELRRRIAT